MAWFPASLLKKQGGLIDMHEDDARTVCLRQETLCNKGGNEAWFGHLNSNNFVVCGQKHKVWVLVF